MTPEPTTRDRLLALVGSFIDDRVADLAESYVDDILALLGFTTEDVELLVEAHNGYDSGDFLGRYGRLRAEKIRFLIARIQALLPPEGK